MENDVAVELRPMNRNLATEFNEYDDGPRFAATNMPSHVDNGKINQSINQSRRIYIAPYSMSQANQWRMLGWTIVQPIRKSVYVRCTQCQTV